MSNNTKPCRQGHATTGDQLGVLIVDHEAEECRGVIVSDLHHLPSATNVVLLVLGSSEGIPIAFAPISCVHGVESIIDRLRLAAAAAFKNQPCTICEKVE